MKSQNHPLTRKQSGSRRTRPLRPIARRLNAGQRGASGKTDFLAIVASAASAGGFEAFTQLLRHSDNTGMAFVIIQH